MSKPTIYELQGAWVEVMGALDEIDGAVTPEIEALLEALEGATEDKAAGYIAVIRQLEMWAAKYDEESKRLAARARTKKTAIKSMRARLQGLMEAAELRKLETPLGLISLRNTPVRVQITGEVPAQYMLPPAAPEPDKKAIKEALSWGPLDFAELRRGTGMTIK